MECLMTEGTVTRYCQAEFSEFSGGTVGTVGGVGGVGGVRGVGGLGWAGWPIRRDTPRDLSLHTPGSAGFSWVVPGKFDSGVFFLDFLAAVGPSSAWALTF